MNRALSLSVFLLVADAAAAQQAEPKVNSAAAKAFATTVLPVVTNVCADCHAHAKHASTFKLKPYDPAYSDPALAEANYKAVVKLLDAASPQDSPLLKYTTSAHGKSIEPPLKAEHPAYKKLALWVYWATAADGSAAPTAIPAPLPDKTVVQVGNIQPAPPTPEPAKLPPLKTTPLPFAGLDPKKANPADPFDPAGFNKK